MSHILLFVSNITG